MKRLLVVVVAVVFAGVACGDGDGEPTADSGIAAGSHDLRGSVTASDGITWKDQPVKGDECTSDSAAVEPGSSVTVEDEDGSIIGTGRVSPGRFLKSGDYSSSAPCEFAFTVTDLPDVEFYAVAISGVAGEQTYSKADLEARNWRLELSAD